MLAIWISILIFPVKAKDEVIFPEEADIDNMYDLDTDTKYYVSPPYWGTFNREPNFTYYLRFWHKNSSHCLKMLFSGGSELFKISKKQGSYNQDFKLVPKRNFTPGPGTYLVYFAENLAISLTFKGYPSDVLTIYPKGKYLYDIDILIFCSFTGTVEFDTFTVMEQKPPFTEGVLGKHSLKIASWDPTKFEFKCNLPQVSQAYKKFGYLDRTSLLYISNTTMMSHNKSKIDCSVRPDSYDEICKLLWYRTSMIPTHFSSKQSSRSLLPNKLVEDVQATYVCHLICPFRKQTKATNIAITKLEASYSYVRVSNLKKKINTSFAISCELKPPRPHSFIQFSIDIHEMNSKNHTNSTRVITGDKTNLIYYTPHVVNVRCLTKDAISISSTIYILDMTSNLGESTHKPYMNESSDSGDEQFLILSSTKVQVNEHFRCIYHGAQVPGPNIRIISLEPMQHLQEYCPMEILNSNTYNFDPICLPGLYNIKCIAMSESGTIGYSKNFTIELQDEIFLEYQTPERFSLQRKMMYLFYSVLWFLILHLLPLMLIYGQRNRNLRRLVQKQFIHKRVMYDRAELIIECIPYVYISYSEIGRKTFNSLSLAIMRHMWMFTEGPCFFRLWTTGKPKIRSHLMSLLRKSLVKKEKVLTQSTAKTTGKSKTIRRRAERSGTSRR